MASSWGTARRPADPGGGFGFVFTSALILLGFALALLILIPALGAAAIFFAFRRLLYRRDWAILALAGIAGFCRYPRDNALGYGYWLLSFVNVGAARPGEPPVTVLLCCTAVLAGGTGIIFGRSIGGLVPGLAWLLRHKRVLQDVLDGTWFRRREHAEDSVTPWEGSREKLKRQVSRRVTLRDIAAVRGPYATERARGTPLQAKSIPLGLGLGGRVVRLSAKEMGMHGCVVGSTGSGKTVTLMWIIGAALDMGFDVTVIDMKEDTEPGGLRDFLRAYSWMHQVPHQEIALADREPAYWFNVLADMSADEAFDTIMSLVVFDDAYWQALNRKILQQVVQLCYRAAEVAPDRFKPPTMLQLGKIMESGSDMRSAVREQVIAIDGAEGVGHCKQRYTNVLRPSVDEAKSAASFGTKLTGLYDSGAGRTILVPGGDRRMVDVRAEGVTYVGLNSLGQPDMAKILSSSTLQRLSVYAAQRIQGRAPKERPRLIVVDEANYIDRDIAMNMLSRVRSALFNMILCTQGPTDWIDKDGDDWSRLTQNINWLIAMAQSSFESAEKCAEFLGMRNNNTLQEHISHSGPSDFRTRAEEEFIVPGRDLRDLGTGEGYLRVNKPYSRIEYVVVPMRQDELRRYEEVTT